MSYTSNIPTFIFNLNMIRFIQWKHVWHNKVAAILYFMERQLSREIEAEGEKTGLCEW